MYVARLLYPIETLGPGKRIVVWTAGCKHRCPGCTSPELQQASPLQNVDVHQFAQMVRDQFATAEVDGITLSGGDPMEQVEEVMTFLQEIRDIVPDVLMYTGYTVNELEAILGRERWQLAKQMIDVLIDGPYVDTLNDNQVPLRGSTNQCIHYWNPNKRELYERYMARGRCIQNVFLNNGLLSVGIPNKERNCEDE